MPERGQSASQAVNERNENEIMLHPTSIMSLIESRACFHIVHSVRKPWSSITRFIRNSQNENQTQEACTSALRSKYGCNSGPAIRCFEAIMRYKNARRQISYYYERFVPVDSRSSVLASTLHPFTILSYT